MRLLLILLFLVFSVNAQTTVGLLYNDIGNSADGYTLFGYKNDSVFYLINNCGEVLNTWQTSNNIGVGYILENGNLLKSGSQGNLEIRDWDNNIIWQVTLTDYGLIQHHDIEPLSNGNILILSRDIYTDVEAIAQGRDPLLLNGNIISEKIVEIQPTGTNSLNIVWEWKLWDHLIQDFDNSKPNYDIVNNHPELLNLNFETLSNSDWIHANAIDYNEDLDQIIISSRHTNEFYIIDHSTTTPEASNHTGGNSGKGGDFLWRWGNPITYGAGTLANQKLFGPHDPKWIPNGYPNAGKITAFNNGFIRTPEFSSIHIIDPMIDSNGNYQISGSYLPTDFFWSWNGDVLGSTVFSISQSGANMQVNGNILLCEATKGRLLEITNSGDLAWAYKNPIGFAGSYAQSTIIPENGNVLFRAEKYPSNYIGFTGKDLTSTGIIENQNILSNDCIANSLTVFEENPLTAFEVYPNPFIDEINIKGIPFEAIMSIKIFSLNGQEVFSKSNNFGHTVKINSDLISKGMYFMQIETKSNFKLFKKIIKVN